MFEGVTYQREIKSRPRPQVWHLVTVDLRAPGLGFLVTPRDQSGDLPYRARTTSQFLREFGAQVAINGDFFQPWHSNHPWDYYPHVGDGVTTSGPAISGGQIAASGWVPRPTLYLSRDNRASFERPSGALWQAISGSQIVLRDGVILQDAARQSAPLDGTYPCTAVGLDRAKRRLFLVVADGRQGRYSSGATGAEVAAFLRSHGADAAMMLDGGGSATLVAQQGREPRVLNSPIDCYLPGRERAVANHLGVFARPLAN